MNPNKITQDLSELNFTAIDFETANEKRASVCSMGLVVVRAGQIVREEHVLVRPKEFRFTEVNMRIHGITPDDVVDAPEFNVIWEKLSPLFHNEILLAHNAAFDRNVLQQTLEAYQLVPSASRYICTLKLAQSAFSGLSGYGLADVARHIGFKLDHHHALSDAKAAAAIGVQALPTLDHSLFHYSHDELTYAINIQRTEESREPRRGYGYDAKHIESDLLKPNLEGANSDNPFYNKKVVFTGDLQTMQRKDAAAKIQAMGADINVAISKQTQIAIIGQKAGPSKMKKIEELKAAGYEIKIIEEAEFLSLIQ